MYGGLGVSDVHRIKALEGENRKLKQLADEQALVIETLKGPHQQRGWLLDIALLLISFSSLGPSQGFGGEGKIQRKIWERQIDKSEEKMI